MTASSPPNAVHYVDIDNEFTGQRIDNFLHNYLKGVPKSRIYRLLRKGEVRVNKRRTRPDYKLAAGDSIRIPPIRVSEPKTAPIPGDHLHQLLRDAVLYEDRDMIVLNKPSGMAVHGGSGIQLGVIEVLRHTYDDSRLELVHRLDRATSGCLLVARRRAVLRRLQDQFRANTVKKTYRALVAGKWPNYCRQVEAPLRKNQQRGGERVVNIHGDGKASTTHFEILERLPGVTLVCAKPVTGRTHQIRVHCQFAGHPIVGDEKYGYTAVNKAMRARGIKRLFLHAAELTFIRPADDQTITLEAPLPAELEAALTDLRGTPASNNHNRRGQ